MTALAESQTFQSRRGPGKLRYVILSMLFVASSISYGDRTALSVTGAAVAGALGLNAVQLGYALSAASLPYLLMQVPSGLLLDRFGSRRIYCGALVLLSFVTVAQGMSGLLTGAAAISVLLAMRFCSGIFSAPIVLANARITANWFPTAERGLASAIFNTAQYSALIVFAPLSAWAAQSLGWPFAFYILGALGLCAAAIFPLVVRSPLRHPLISPSELAHIEAGGGLVHIETAGRREPGSGRFFRRIAFQRPLIGLYLFQYCIGVLSSFFMTWFPIYLVMHSGLSVWHAGIGTAVPAVFGMVGGITGGVISDVTLRRTGSLSFARGLPVFIGLSAALAMLLGNVMTAPLPLIAIMSIAFFGKGVAALGWTMVSDIAPRNMIGATGGLFNMISASAGVLTPLVMGYVVHATGSFNWAVVYVAAHSVLGMAAFALLIRRIERLEM